MLSKAASTSTSEVATQPRSGLTTAHTKKHWETVKISCPSLPKATFQVTKHYFEVMDADCLLRLVVLEEAIFDSVISDELSRSNRVGNGLKSQEGV